ncbi:unnamed protein product [Spirodela intermedia]|uniref:Uncharacterized protein n=1 Tax=Spirodela intermedia TaxID=51605 RepID=A0A7I8IIZ0_SPIIN|nr:unnamed protein product [Spirodela intermedia]CAA6657868.1 unnamed protein product [Spirodela intermedia]
MLIVLCPHYLSMIDTRSYLEIILMSPLMDVSHPLRKSIASSAKREDRLRTSSTKMKRVGDSGSPLLRTQLKSPARYQGDSTSSPARYQGDSTSPSKSLSSKAPKTSKVFEVRGCFPLLKREGASPVPSEVRKVEPP